MEIKNRGNPPNRNQQLPPAIPINMILIRIKIKRKISKKSKKLKLKTLLILAKKVIMIKLRETKDLENFIEILKIIRYGIVKK